MPARGVSPRVRAQARMICYRLDELSLRPPGERTLRNCFPEYEPTKINYPSLVLQVELKRPRRDALRLFLSALATPETLAEIPIQALVDLRLELWKFLRVCPRRWHLRRRLIHEALRRCEAASLRAISRLFAGSADSLDRVEEAIEWSLLHESRTHRLGKLEDQLPDLVAREIYPAYLPVVAESLGDYDDDWRYRVIMWLGLNWDRWPLTENEILLLVGALTSFREFMRTIPECFLVIAVLERAYRALPAGRCHSEREWILDAIRRLGFAKDNERLTDEANQAIASLKQWVS